jgi:hypothetical protein
MIYFSLMKELSNMVFLHLKCMHLGAVSLDFMRVAPDIVAALKIFSNMKKKQISSILFFFWKISCFKESPPSIMVTRNPN